MEQKAKQERNADSGTTSETSPLEELKKMSTTYNLDEMERNLQNDFFVIHGMALSGQITLFYAKPNTGKTLILIRLIIDSIKEGRISADDVFYINADDHYKGIYTKTKIACEHGFSMISPADCGATPAQIIALLEELAGTDDATGKVIFLDTLKKFADMMDKRSLKALFESLRKLTSKNASVIIAGHANKHLDLEGKLVYEGTGDAMNDIDCAYALYPLGGGKDDCVVEFRMEKSRGDVHPVVTYAYTKTDGSNYYELLESVRKLDDDQAQKASKCDDTQRIKSKYDSEALFLAECLSESPLIQSEIISIYDSGDYDIAAEFTKATLKAALSDLIGIVLTVTRGDKNAKVFDLISAQASRYSSAKNGE